MKVATAEEYTKAEVTELTKRSSFKLKQLVDRKVIIRTRPGFFTRASIGAYLADIQERLAIMGKAQ